ncbi:PDR/VanB family oxidoreductase [Pantoea sp. 18069]|uniref:PDR/VanB family oxidoreductase n=1 Tax=Pantoea sp. 18069 TaxID=2681415 RepID=UPI0013588624|nr:PDR/VanB family oxidoreductase [Pantoea sp. 18069]
MNAATLQVRVAHKSAETPDISRFELVAAGGQALPAFTAGAHIDVHLPGGLVRQYSLSNDPRETQRYVLGVLRDAASRGGSQAMHDAVHEGSVLQISAPKNHFALAEQATEHLLFAGGIGITPILSMARQLQAAATPFRLLYCTRSEAATAFRAELAATALQPHVTHHFSSNAAAPALDLAAALGAPREGLHLSVCGPKGFIDWVLSTARTLGWPEARLHCEFFAGEAVDLSAAGSFQVKIASSGRCISIPRDQTIVQALALGGIEIQTSCEQGVCGTCLTRVLAGRPEHKDMYLTEDEQARNDQFLPCCSRSLSPELVLDL